MNEQFSVIALSVCFNNGTAHLMGHRAVGFEILKSKVASEEIGHYEVEYVIDIHRDIVWRADVIIRNGRLVKLTGLSYKTVYTEGGSWEFLPGNSETNRLRAGGGLFVATGPHIHSVNQFAPGYINRGVCSLIPPTPMITETAE